jgi:hypothetical protein
MTMSNPNPTDRIPASGDVMDLFQDEAWLREAVRIEDEFGGEISAGPELGAGWGKFWADPEGYQRMLRLKRVVLREFRGMLVEYDLGLWAEAAWVCGRPLVMARLESPSVEVQGRLLGVLVEGDQGAMSGAVVREVLREVLGPEDWVAIASAAAIAVQRRVMLVGGS